VHNAGRDIANRLIGEPHVPDAVIGASAARRRQERQPRNNANDQEHPQVHIRLLFSAPPVSILTVMFRTVQSPFLRPSLLIVSVMLRACRSGHARLSGGNWGGWRRNQVAIPKGHN
jgi:hypothetical protein